MKTYVKTVGRMFAKNLIRFFSIVFIVTVSVGLISGIGTSAEKIDSSLAAFYKTHNVSDFIFKSTDGGFTTEQVRAAEALCGEANVNAGASLDAKMRVGERDALVRLYFVDTARVTVNVPDRTAGKALSDLEPTEAVCIAATDRLRALGVGETLTLDFADILRQNGADAEVLASLQPTVVTVAGQARSAIAFAHNGEPAYRQREGVTATTVNDLPKLECLDYIFYLLLGAVPQIGGVPVLGTLDLAVALPDRAAFGAFSARYKSYAAEQKAALLKAVGGSAGVITLSDNVSFSMLHGSADTIYNINAVLLVAFALVAALVVSTTVTRLLEEERGQIACLRSLGYSGGRILFKYILFALCACAVAGVAGYLLGLGLAAVIYRACSYSFVLPPMSRSVAVVYFLLTFFSIVAATLVATAVAGARMLHAKPADLMRPKAPRAGRKVILEKIPALWNRLSFKYKSTMRNVLRYRSRFIMTVTAVACSMALVIAGLALLDLCLFGGMRSPALTWLSVVIVIFAGLLTMAVIYTLTNVNVSERTREIATLMVLGYQDGEVAGYIYREVFINTAVGIVFGYPAGALLLYAVFTMMNFGSLGGVSWFVWLLAPVVVLLFTGLVALLLRRRIVGIDMNDSLKAVE